MKKIFFSIVAIAALAACSKSEVAYEQTQEIGFKAVAGNMTKTAVDGNAYPTTLNMYVYAWTSDFSGTSANYISNGLFVHKGAFEDYTGKDDASDKNPNVWGGQTPYYWPNTKNLYFAGYSASGNVADLTPQYNCSTGVLSIEGYTPGTEANNDLMFFPKTTESYGKSTDYVPVNMLHTCSWITFLVKGDGVTGINSSTYKVDSLAITNIYATGDLTCQGTNVEWDVENYSNASKSTVLKANSALSLAGTYISDTQATPIKAETTEDNTVLIPQLPGMLELVYSYTSPAGVKITETRTGATALDLTLDGTGEKTTEWIPGKHYIYTITIKANEILIAPTPVDWTDENFGVTVE